MEQTDKRKTGLTEAQAALSAERFGKNVYERKKRKSFFKLLLDNFSDPIIRILLLALAVNLLFTIRNVNVAETVGILAAVAISTFVSAFSEYSSERAFEKLREENESSLCSLLRDGKIRSSAASELVVGDVVLLGSGEKIPADGILISGELSVDESVVNGESEPSHKQTKESFHSANDQLFAGAMVLEGEGKMEVTAVGSNSVYGRIAGEIQAETGDSPLKLRLKKLAGAISKIGYVAAALVALAYLFNVFLIDSAFDLPQILEKCMNLRFLAMHAIKAVTIAMTVIVVAVPEGLPMMITVVLSSNMKRMMKDHVLVRKMIGIETAGCMNVLFTDKTGTLTEGKPVCRELVLGNGDRIPPQKPLRPALKSLLEESIFLNTSCKVTENGILGGNATERALCGFFPNGVQRIDDGAYLPFNSANKYSCKAVNDGTGRVFFKGAQEKLLPYCRYCYDDAGRIVSFDRERMRALIRNLSADCARVLVLAVGNRFASPENAGELIFLCIAVMRDGLRKSAKASVQTLKEAGIHTVMITGDAPETAQKIATECGLIDARRRLVITGKELGKMSDREVIAKLDEIAVIARALPSDKSRLVDLSKEKGLVVGMTGDGVNDAPALKKADVGFSMGSGADVAKEASDILILDNDLHSIVKAVLYGRTIFKSIRKFITFQLIMNLCAVGVSFIGQLMGIDSPITVIQMLWVNVIMDTLGGLAFSGEYPQNFYLKERPISREEPILHKEQYVQILIMGVYAVTMCSCFLGSARVRDFFGFPADPLPLLTAFFALFIFTGIAICFTARSERLNLLSGLKENKAFVTIMSLIILIQICMLYFGGKTFRCVGMSPKALLLTAALVCTVFPVDLIRRLIQKRRNGERKKKEERKRSNVKLTE